MKNSIELFNYNLPSNLIASKPRSKREQAKLMIYNQKSNDVSHSIFSNLHDYLNKGDLLVLNNTKVLPGRLFLKKESGGSVEILFHKKVNEFMIECIFKSSRKILVNSKLYIDNDNYFLVKKVKKNIITLSCINNPMGFFERYGEVPLPKYIKRRTTDEDINRYQTVYAKEIGSVAAPTAGLHFTNDILFDLKKRGVGIEYLTLHVTYNTFKPISVDNYNLHEIGSAVCIVEKELMSKIEQTKNNQQQVEAVGTTATRARELCN